jgi:hypothetical protein
VLTARVRFARIDWVQEGIGAMKRVRWFVLIALALGVLALPATAFAAPRASVDPCTYPDNNCPPPSVLGATTVPPANNAAPATAGVEAAQSSLPFTGGDFAGLAAIGAGAILVGFLLVRTRRKPGSSS